MTLGRSVSRSKPSSAEKPMTRARWVLVVFQRPVPDDRLGTCSSETSEIFSGGNVLSADTPTDSPQANDQEKRTCTKPAIRPECDVISHTRPHSLSTRSIVTDSMILPTGYDSCTVIFASTFGTSSEMRCGSTESANVRGDEEGMSHRTRVLIWFRTGPRSLMRIVGKRRGARDSSPSDQFCT